MILPMKSHRLLIVLGLAAFAVYLGFCLPAHAMVGDPMVNEARTDLEKAWNPAGNQPSNADRATLLKAAMNLIKRAPRALGTGARTYNRHLRQAVSFIESALSELDKGDPDQKAGDFIHSAVSEVRDIT
jgi:hypothetical protein